MKFNERSIIELQSTSCSSIAYSRYGFEGLEPDTKREKNVRRRQCNLLAM